MKLFSRSRQMLNRGCAAALATATLLLPGALRAEPTQIGPTDFERSFTITFPGMEGLGTLTDFPVLIRLSAARNAFDYSKCKVANGGDLRFSDADGNLLASEVDTWNPDGESLVWVKVPLLNTATTITAYYGCANPAEVNPKSVWSNGYVGVWHLGENGLTFPDSTINGLDFSCSQNHASYVGRGVENGAVGKSVEFGVDESTAGCLLAEDSDLLDGFQTVTFEFWTYQTTHAPGRNITLFKKKGSENTAFRFYQNNNDPRTLVGFFLDGYSGTWWANAAQGSGTIPLDQWNYQAYTYNWKYSDTQSRSYGYLNGSQIASRSANDGPYTFLSNAGKLCLGNESSSGSNAYAGRMDEFRISNVARSVDWVKATYDTVNNDEFAIYQVPNDWKLYSHTFSVSFPGATNGVLSAFPILVKLSEASIPGFRYADCRKENGGDLRFANAEGNLLDSEIDTWNTNGVSLVWVNVPSLDNNTAIKAYYGWDFAPSADTMNVWTNGYVGVWHLSESGLPVKDSTVNPANFTLDRTGVLYEQTGIVGSSVRFHNGDTATNSYLKADESVTGKLDGFAAVTFEAWTCQYWHKESPAYAGYILAKDRGTGYNSYKFFEDAKAGNNTRRFMQINGDINKTNAVSAFGLVPFSASEDIWNYQVFSYDSQSEATKKAAYYLNGVLNNTSDIGSDPLPSTTSPLYLGNMHGYAKWGYAFPGKIDEVRISNVARSPEWLRTTYDMIKGNADFSSYGSARANKVGTIVYYK